MPRIPIYPQLGAGSPRISQVHRRLQIAGAQVVLVQFQISGGVNESSDSSALGSLCAQISDQFSHIFTDNFRKYTVIKVITATTH